MSFLAEDAGLRREWWRRPWRSTALGWAVAGLTLVVGVPLFLCMPPWNDVTLHDMAVRSILRGGVHYRDVFDTNLPGIDWGMAAVRGMFGWSYEVLRAADLIVIGAAVAVLCGWVRRCGTASYTVAWFVATVSLFYLFTSEFNHVQRDPWMLLPAVVAARLRLRRLREPTPQPPDPPPPPPPSLQGGGSKSDSPLPAGRGAGGGGHASSILEGFIWGLAVWVKPHALVPAISVWVVSVLLLRARSESWKRIATDFAGLLLGGILAGLPGILWLVGTGAWPYFLDTFLNWNPAYLAESESFPLEVRFHTVFTCFGAWSVIHFAAIPLALRALWNAREWARRPGDAAPAPASRFYLQAANEQEAFARALLAAFYLAWLAQVVFVQKPFEYAHVPLTLLAMAVVAGQRWCFGFAYAMWFLAIGLLVNSGAQLKFEPHPITDRNVLKLWPRCWTEGSSPEMRDRLGQFTNSAFGTNWRDLNAVAEFLRKEEPSLGPGELNCWHDTTHPLYLMLNCDPATRYMHYGTVFRLSSKREMLAEEVRASKQRYVVSDLLRTTQTPGALSDPASWQVGDPLPVWLPSNEREKFPWNQPVVFRSGRYVVHKIDPGKLLGVIRVPDWEKLDRLGELKPDE